MALSSDIEASIIKVAGDMAISHNQTMLTQQKRPARLDVTFKTYYLQIMEIVDYPHGVGTDDSRTAGPGKVADPVLEDSSFFPDVS
jgi:hypothetical protein